MMMICCRFLALTIPAIRALVFGVVAIGALAAAPPEPIAALVGEWSGESTLNAVGESVPAHMAAARRYWAEGDIVRGEILIGGANRLQAWQVTILPRAGRFLKIITPEGEAPELLVGVAAEGGVRWSRVNADHVRFVERVTGTGEQRELQLMTPEDEPAKAGGWRVVSSLKPAQAALSGVIGDGVAAAEPVTPLALPTPAELALLDRLAELIEQRDAARDNEASLARELAAAWREGQTAGDRIRALEVQLTEAKLGSASSSSPAIDVAGLEQRVRTAEQHVVEARRRAEEAEQSLREASTRAQESATRLEQLARELATAEETNARLRSERDQFVQQAERHTRQAQDEAGRVAALETELAQLRTSVARGEAAESAQAQLTARVAELQQQLADAANARQELEARVQASVAATARIEQEAAAASERVKSLQREKSALEAQLAQASRENGAVEELQRQLRESVTVRTGLEEELATLRAQVVQLAAAQQAAEEAAGAARTERDEAQERATALAASLTELEQSTRAGREAESTQRRALEDELNSVQARAAELERSAADAHAQLAGMQARLAELQATKDAEASSAANAQTAALETRLAEAFARAEQRQQRIDELSARNASLELEQQALAARVAELNEALTRASSTAGANDGEIAELRRRLAESEETRVALEMQTRELSQQVQQLQSAANAAPIARSPAGPPASRPTQPVSGNAAPVPASVPPRTAVNTGGAAIRRAPTRPTDADSRVSVGAPVGSDSRLAQAVRNLPISGYRRAGPDTIIVISGRTYRVGEVVDVQRGLRLARVDADAIVFTGPDGGEYRFGL